MKFDGILYFELSNKDFLFIYTLNPQEVKSFECNLNELKIKTLNFN